MHILLALLGSIITILVLLKRLGDVGIDLGGLNPFLWHRRRRWRLKVEGDPIFSIADPMEATAILLVAVAKADGDMAVEQKNQLLTIFNERFHLSAKEAADLMVSSVHLLGDGFTLRNNVEKFLAASVEHFSASQKISALELINEVAGSPSGRHDNVRDLASKIENVFIVPEKNEKVW